MVGMIESIFGKTPYQLQYERNKQRNKLLSPSTAPTREERAAEDIGSLLGLGAAMLFKDTSVDPEMEKAKQVEAQQTALNERTKGMRSDDPLYYMTLSNAYSSTGNTEAAAEYAQIAARYEEIAERRRQKYRDEQMELANLESERLDEIDISEASFALLNDPENQEAIKTIYSIAGPNAPNVLYSIDNLRKSKQKSNEAQTFYSGLIKSLSQSELLSTQEVQQRAFELTKNAGFNMTGIPEPEYTQKEVPSEDDSTLTLDELNQIEEEKRKQKEEEENTSDYTRTGRNRRK